MTDYISRDAALAALDELERTSKHNSVLWPDHVEECREALRGVPAADVRPVVLCGICELHRHCYVEDVCAFAGLAEENRFCAVGKVKTNGEGRRKADDEKA